jgi:hypothetical protein
MGGGIISESIVFQNLGSQVFKVRGPSTIGGSRHTLRHIILAFHNTGTSEKFL